MSRNKKQSSRQVFRLAATTLADRKASRTAKSLAGSVLAQANTDKQTGAVLENQASRVLQSPKYSEATETLAGSVLSQADKGR